MTSFVAVSRESCITHSPSPQPADNKNKVCNMQKIFSPVPVSEIFLYLFTFISRIDKLQFQFQVLHTTEVTLTTILHVDSITIYRTSLASDKNYCQLY